jgi:hypothetical protein
MNDDFVLKSGKYAGKSIGWLKSNNQNYLNWVMENQPNMLKELKKIEPKNLEALPTKTMSPNLNFDNEGPDPLSLIYLNDKNNKLKI